MNIINTEKIKELIYELLKELGENPDRDGLKETPQRISDMCLELFDNKYSEQDLVKIFEEKRTENNIIEINNISFCSFCEHHLLPFYGTVSIKYLPKNMLIWECTDFGGSNITKVLKENGYQVITTHKDNFDFLTSLMS